MMKQEDKQLLLKDLCSRLSYGVKVQVCNATEYTPILKGILGDDLFLQFDYITKPIKNGDSTYNLIEDNIKPYLRPMSDMTKEEKKELLCILVGKKAVKHFQVLSDGSIESTDAKEQNLENFSFQWINFDVFNTTSYIDWLNAHHFDYRNLIKLGLALPAPEGMYKF